LFTLPMYNAASGSPLPAWVPGITQAFGVDLDAIVKAIFPDDALATTKIMMWRLPSRAASTGVPHHRSERARPH
jgi:hypothetical protein